ncbi:hypothetical protein CEUSTIGMA_g9746.t1 [Chlamydomonas eustigma]|uniref:EF-hand domain-containing protein n=1 Tax=Chlamydomonas eustigma TaxID=1157962 RepID=A0A250XGW2_9CHLO|nr:hypothetical protein CEUSTIGMA_g9746.t1 [Chlamydomonas eustigma]|eukprot:GAX82317.1 hypothetical protein CEUSTIGMA_g9746.t1 [Chlamydomonas eustigma]
MIIQDDDVVERSIDVPANTSKPLAVVDSILGTSIMSWMRRHGKVVRPKLPKEQLKQLEECFHLMDQDGSGSIDVDELGAAFKLLGIQLTHHEIQEIVQEVDDEGTGELGIAEFLEIMTTTMHKLAEDESGTRQPTVPFGLVATAYRRKRLLEGIMTSDKEVRAQLQQLNEKQAQEALLAEVEAEEAKKVVVLKKEKEVFNDNKLKASVFGPRRMRELERLHIDEALVAALPLEDQRLVIATLAKVSGVSSLTRKTQSVTSSIGNRQPWGKPPAIPNASKASSLIKSQKSSIFTSSLRKETSGCSVLLGLESCSKQVSVLRRNAIILETTPKVFEIKFLRRQKEALNDNMKKPECLLPPL